MRAAIGLRHPASASCLGRRSSSLHSAHIQRKEYFKFRVSGKSADFPETHFHGRRRRGKRHLQRRFLRKCGAAGGRLLPLGGAVAQRLRGFKSAKPEKTVKRSSRRTGVNLQFFPVQPSSLGLKGASSPFFVAPARRNRWWFSGSLLPPKENIPRLPPPTPQRCNCRFFSTLSVKNTLCKKLTGKLRRTSRLTDTKVFFITAKDPARGSTPRCGGTSAPRREP